MFAHRMEQVRAAMADRGLDVLLLSVGPDLPWLIGYEAMPLERLTMLVLPVDGQATLVVPALEAPRVVERGDLFTLAPFGEADDPVRMVATMVGGGSTRVRLAVGDRTWARFVVDLQSALPGASWHRASTVTGPLRAVKDSAEIEALRRAGAAADRVIGALQAGEVALIGRTEAEVAADLGSRLIAEGHAHVNFTIVAAGENAASPHHEPGSRVIRPDEVVLCDIGGTMLSEDGVGYCSDITRCVATGAVESEISTAYDALRSAQADAVAAARVGTSAGGVDAVARARLTEAGFGERFIHRTGHGIGVEEHEDPYLVRGNEELLVAGHAFSVEPGIYTPGRWGLRLEDIVVATANGPDLLNLVGRELMVVES